MTPVRIVIADAARDYLGLVGTATRSQLVVAVANQLGASQRRVAECVTELIHAGNLRVVEMVRTGVPRRATLNSDRYRWEGVYLG